MSYDLDFRTIKERARFEVVIRRYKLGEPPRRVHYFIQCPFHRETDPSCRIDSLRNRFRCFGCGAKGSILDFIARLEGISIKRAAELVATWCGEGPANSQSPARPMVEPGKERTANEPLRLTLNLDPAHPYLASRGLSAATIARFGLGYCDRGLMLGRIAIPIHDHEAQLIAYAGRWAAEPVPHQRPRYLLPRGFQKQLVLFNLHRVKDQRSIVLVESYWSVFRLDALGVPAVALMGRELSTAHIELFRLTGIDHIRLMLDGDAPGRDAASKMLPVLAQHLFVQDLRLPEQMKPHSAPEPILFPLLGLDPA